MKWPKCAFAYGERDGARDRDRTCDLRLRRALLFRWATRAKMPIAYSQKSISRKEKMSKDSIQKNSRVLFENLIVYAVKHSNTESLFFNWISFFQDLGTYLLSHVNPRSTIDVTRLNCCVRKGNRCTPCTIDTKILKKRMLFWNNKKKFLQTSSISNILRDYIHTNIPIWSKSKE